MLVTRDKDSKCPEVCSFNKNGIRFVITRCTFRWLGNLLLGAYEVMILLVT